MPVYYQRGFSHIIVLLILFGGIIGGVYLTQNKTNLFPQAAQDKKACPKIELTGNIEVVSRQGCKKASEILEGKFLCTISTNYISTKDIPGASSKCENINYYNQKAQKYCKNLTKSTCLPNASPSSSPSANQIKAAVIFVYFNNGTNAKTLLNPERLIRNAKALEPSSKPTPRPIDPVTGSHITVNYVKQMLQGSGDDYGYPSVKAYFDEVTHGKIGYTFDYFGWYQAQIPTPQNCNIDSLMQLADGIVVNQGVDLTTYKARVYIFPGISSCPNHAYGGKDPTKSYSYAFMDDFSLSDVYVHELGHALNLAHAGRWDCRSPNDYTNNCTLIEQGDFYDIMGGTGYFNAPHQEMLGLIGSDQIQTVTTSGQFEIAPIELDTRNKQVLKIKKNDTENYRCINNSCQNYPDYYYIEYRRPIGIDANVSLETNREGIQIRISDGFNEVSNFTKLINPEDPVLEDGEFIYDSINDLKIKQISHDNNKAKVEITFGPNPYKGPVKPTLVQDGCGKGTVSFHWNPVSSATQYKIYKDNALKTTTGSDVLRYEETTDPSINSLYHVIAVDNSGVSSAPSNSVGSDCSN